MVAYKRQNKEGGKLVLFYAFVSFASGSTSMNIGNR